MMASNALLRELAPDSVGVASTGVLRTAIEVGSLPWEDEGQEEGARTVEVMHRQEERCLL